MVGQPRVRPSLGFVGGTLSIRPRTSELTSEDAKRLRDPIKALAVRSQTGAGDSAKADDEARLPRIATPPDGARPGTSRGTPPRLNSPTSVADETSLFTVTAKRTPHPPVVGGREVPPRELAATWERPHTSASPVRKVRRPLARAPVSSAPSERRRQRESALGRDDERSERTRRRGVRRPREGCLMCAPAPPRTQRGGVPEGAARAPEASRETPASCCPRSHTLSLAFRPLRRSAARHAPFSFVMAMLASLRGVGGLGGRRRSRATRASAKESSARSECCATRTCPPKCDNTNKSCFLEPSVHGFINRYIYIWREMGYRFISTV